MSQKTLSNGELLLYTPGGLRPRSLVHIVPSGMRLHVTDNQEVVAIDADGVEHSFDPPSAEALAWLNDPNHPERRSGPTRPVSGDSPDRFVREYLVRT